MIKKILIYLLFLINVAVIASIPKQISYQGILTDALGQPKADGTYSLTFKLYNVPSEGNNIWSETKTVSLKNGVFTTILGSDSALVLPFDTTYYLGISLGTGGEYAPRIQLTSSGYAIRSIVSDSAVSAYSSVVSGSSNSAIVADSSRAAHFADSTKCAYKAVVSDSATFSITASTIPATAIAAGSIDSTKLAASSVGSSEIADGSIVTADVDSTFKAPNAVKADYATLAGSVAGTSISGKIITDTIMALDTNGLALINAHKDGIFIDSLGNVGVGVDKPYGKLYVKNTGRINGIIHPLTHPDTAFYNEDFAVANDGGSASGYIYASNNSGSFPFDKYGEMIIQGNPRTHSVYNGGVSFVTGDSSKQSIKMRITEAGNVGIGISNPVNNLEVAKVGTGGYAPQFQMSGFGTGTSSHGYLKFQSSSSNTLGEYLTTDDGTIFGNIDGNGVNTSNAVANAARIFLSQDGAAGADFLPGRIAFLTADSGNASERMRITRTGSIGIGTTSPVGKLHVLGSWIDTTIPWVTFEGGGSVSPNVALRLYDRGTAGTNENTLQFAHGSSTKGAVPTARITSKVRANHATTGSDLYLETYSDDAGALNSGQLRLINNGNISMSGDLSIVGNLTVAGTFSNPSDIRYKKNIYPIENAIEKLKKLGGFYYDWKRAEFPKKKFSGRRQVGVIAQDVEKVLPEVVHTDENGYKSVAYDKLTALLIEAVKTQQEQLEEQQKALDKVENTVEMVKNLLNENALLRKQIASIKEKVDPALKVNLHYDLEENENEKK